MYGKTFRRLDVLYDEGFVEDMKLPFVCSIPGATQHEQVLPLPE